MADHTETNNYVHGEGTLDSQRQPEPVSDSMRLAQEKGSTHQFAPPDAHEIPHMAAVAPSPAQTFEGQFNETTSADTGSRKRTSKKSTSASGSKRASIATKTTSSSKRTPTKGTRGGTHAQHQAAGRQSHKK